MNNIKPIHLWMTVVSLLLFTSSCRGMQPKKQCAWIEERFAKSIIDDRSIEAKYLFPIEGFEEVNDTLYILVYGGELQPVSHSGNESDCLIGSFSDLINTQVWPDSCIEAYGNAVITCRKAEKDIIVTIKTSEEVHHYKYISSIDGSRFCTILEIKGWLLNYLISPVFSEYFDE